MTRTLALPVLLAAAVAAAAPPPIQSHRLKNGLQVLVVEDHALPLVTIEVVVKNGAMTEPPELNGLSHLYEHMFFKANDQFPRPDETINRASEMGAVFNASTREELVKAAAELFAVVKSGKVRISINQTYPLAEAAQAHRDLEARKTTGSTVLLP